MDVERELRTVERRVERSTRDRVYRALARIEGLTVEEYLAQQRAKALMGIVTTLQERIPVIVQQFNRIGDTIAGIYENVAKWWPQR